MQSRFIPVCISYSHEYSPCGICGGTQTPKRDKNGIVDEQCASICLTVRQVQAIGGNATTDKDKDDDKSGGNQYENDYFFRSLS